MQGIQNTTRGKDNGVTNSRLTGFGSDLKSQSYHAVLADPPWRFKNRHSKLSPENPNNYHYPTLSVEQIADLPVSRLAATNAHLYCWTTNSNIDDGLFVMNKWGFTYKTIVVWRKTRKDGNTSHAGLGYYFRNATEILLFGTKGSLPLVKTERHVNVISAMRREHSRKPDETYKLIESTSPGPYVELFARTKRKHWDSWGNETRKFAA